MRVLVVDDEPLARMRIEDLLAHDRWRRRRRHRPTNGIEAVEHIRALKPDLVFLDVQMPGKTGSRSCARSAPSAMPATIFVTAFDQFAVQAFDVAAVDYLVKPFDDERFEAAFARARQRLAMEGFEQAPRAPPLGAPGRSRILRCPSAAAAPQPYLERIAVEMRGKVRSIPVEEIDYIVADGPYAELHAGDRRHLIRESMQTLEERLDPKHFMRVHRSMIVRLDLVDTLHRGAGGDYECSSRTARA